MMRTIFSILILLTIGWGKATAQHVSEQQDSLSTSILINPNDLLHTIPEWDVATTDGFTYRVNSGLYGFYGPQPATYLNGIPVDFSFFSWQNMNMLPLSMEKVTSISYRSTPQVYKQSIAGAGYLNIHTAMPDSGFHAHGSFTLGNQIEDPGPFSYDSTKVTPNIDRRGPHYLGELSYLGSHWYAKGQISLRQHQPTNLNNHHRIASYSFVDGVYYPIKNIINNGIAEVGYSSEKWTFRTRALYSENEEYLFFQPFGREIPGITGYKQLALQGSRIFHNWTIKGRYIGQENTIDYRINNKDYNFDWNQLSHSFSLSGHFNKKGFQLSSGAILEYADTKGLQLKNDQFVGTFFGNITLPIHADHSLHGDLTIDIATLETATTASLGSSHSLTDDWTLSADIAYNELLYYRQQNSSYWVKRGYNIYNQLGIGQSLPFSSQKNRSFSTKLTNQFQLASATTLSLEGEYLHHADLNIPWQVVERDEDVYKGLYTLPQDFEFTSENGNRLKLNLTFSQRISPVIAHSIDLIGQYTLDGTSRYQSYWKQIPQHRLNYEFKYQPVSDLSLSMMGTYRSSTTWREYQNLDGFRYRSLQPQYPFQYGTFHTRTPSFFNVNITAKKWFWDQRLATTFSVRNLLNTEVRYHTLGLDKALQFVIKASLSL